MKKENSLSTIIGPQQLSKLSTELKEECLVLLSSDILLVCDYYRYRPERYILNDAALSIAKINKNYKYDVIKECILSYKFLGVEYFSMAGLITYVQNEVIKMAHKELQEQKQREKEAEQRKLENIPPLTPEQEAERIRKRDEFFKHVDKIAADKTVSKKESKPLTKKEKEYQEYKKEYLRGKV